MRARAEAASLNEGYPLDLLHLVSPYGRDRRVALRVERMPSRSRLSRGRNNGDGSWSLTRDELEGLFFFPPRGSNEIPTLVVRIIGLDSDNGATLEVVDAMPGELQGDGDGDDAAHAHKQDGELKKLREELAKAKASFRATQSDLTEARKAFEAELQERLAEAEADANAQAAMEIEKVRAKWQAEAKERLAKQEARAEERLVQARETWRREAETEIAKAEEAWKTAESTRQVATQTTWREESARALEKEQAAHARTKAALDSARKVIATPADDSKVRELREEVERLQNGRTEHETRIVEAERAAAAAREDATRERDQAAYERKEFALKFQQIEAKLAQAKASRERNDSSETKRLRADLAAAEAKLTEQLSNLAQAQDEAADARKEASALQSALAKAEGERKAAESSRERGVSVETKRLRADLAAAETTLSKRDRELAELHTEATAERARAYDLQAALANAEEAAKTREASRLSASKTAWEAKWRLESDARIAALEDKLRSTELALQEARLQAKRARDKDNSGEPSRLAEQVKSFRNTLDKRNLELADAIADAKRVREGTEREIEMALADAKREWEANEGTRFGEAKAEWERHSSRVFKKAQIRLEAAEAALAEARAEASASRDRRDSAEFRRLRGEFATVSAKLADCEAQLAEAQLAAGRARERTRDEVEAAVAKAEEAWKSSEALRGSEVETRERERGTRALAEAMARLERTEAALAEAKSEMEIDRERAAVQLAETTARFEKAQTALIEANERIETMRDPANETELHRLRNEIANLQVAYSDREAELAVIQVAGRKARERGADQARAAVLRAEDDWRREEARRLEAAKLEWERQAHIAAEMSAAPQLVSESSLNKPANRLLLDSALAVGFAAAVVLGFTFYWHTPSEGLSDASAALPPKNAQQAAPVVAQNVTPEVLVAASIARIRTAPNSRASVVTTVRRGIQVSLLERRGDWAHVHAAAIRGKPAIDGWMFSAALRLPGH